MSKCYFLSLAFSGCIVLSSLGCLNSTFAENQKSYESLLAKAYADHKAGGGLYEMESVEIFTQSESKSFSAFNVTLRYFSTELFLQMEKNRVTMSKGVTLIWFHENGRNVSKDLNVDDCEFYQGHVDNDTDSMAAMSICGKQLEGTVVMKNQRFVIKAKNGSTYRTRRSTNGIVLGPHWIIQGPVADGNDNKYGVIDIPLNRTTKRRLRREDTALLLSETKYVEFYIVNDKSEYVWLGSNLQNNMKRMKQIANIVDSFYQPHNIRIVLKAVEVWTDSDKFTIKSSIQETLMAFLNYRTNTILKNFYNDNAVLVSRVDFTGATIGLAPMNGMCNTQNSGNVNQDTNWDYSHVAATITHELGHNFGMDHDGAGCVCHDQRAVCIMSPYAQNPIPKKFSECSKQNLVSYLNKGFAGCLMNKPDTGIYYEDKQCGNNKLDPGEDCDCGHSAYCQNPCCDPNTCKYTSGSQCSPGRCCENCKLKPLGTVCRGSMDPCDITETCDGANGECPENLYKQDGGSCNEHGQNGLCFRGFCRTQNGQCKRVWGSETIGADSSCYSVLNPIGDQYGNCGVSGGYYVRCNRADAQCGKLFCDNVQQNRFPIIGYGKSRYIVSFSTYGRVVYCYSGETNLGQSQLNPLLMSDGVICGSGLACRNQRCVSASQLLTNPCPGNCNGHGVCTQKGTCICDQGWQPPNCDVKATTSTTPATTTIKQTSQKLDATYPSNITTTKLTIYNNTMTTIRGNAAAIGYQPGTISLILTCINILLYYL